MTKGAGRMRAFTTDNGAKNIFCVAVRGQGTQAIEPLPRVRGLLEEDGVASLQQARAHVLLRLLV